MRHREFMVRLFGILIARFCYRLRVFGLENIPVEGPALLVSNHVTMVDAVLLMAAQPRRLRVLMYRRYYENRFLQPLFRLMGVIPIASDDPPRRVLEALKQAREALQDGYIVCIFAEGALTRTGVMRAFRPGFERIVRGTAVPVIPAHIGGAWGSIFSYYHGKLLASILPRRFPYRVAIAFGRPLPSSATVQEVRLAVQVLGGEIVNHLKHRRRVLPYAFACAARRYWWRGILCDTSGRRLRYLGVLTGAVAMARVLRRELGPGKHVGVVLPASVAGALVNVALAMIGRVPVNLNFTASAEAFASARRQAGIAQVISARAFLEKLTEFRAPDGVVYLEELSARIGVLDKAVGFLKGFFAPPGVFAREAEAGPDDTATIIFSSGSTAEPKGVMLSHHNILSNIESFSSLLHFSTRDRMCAALPFFHSFGFTVTLWCPLVCGFAVAYHANPLDGETIAKLVRQVRATIFLATPTFLLAYIRRAKREDFATLRYVITGAEKLKQRIAAAFEEQFGLRPLEGYGTTELSPAASVNIPDVTATSDPHRGTKEGSIGHPLPGVSMKIVDIKTGELLPYGAEGVLLVHGPNVMRGYLNEPAMTAEVLKDGWYNTGDVGSMDEDGFVFLVDRLTRFSKIGGEMVPHTAIEEKLHAALKATNQVLVVTAIPDERKGEQLVVLYTPEAGDPKALHKLASGLEMPNLWRPRSENYFSIECIPMLGSGKLDLKRIKALATLGVEERPGLVRKVVDRIRDVLHPAGGTPRE